MGNVLKDAVPLVLAHHKYYYEGIRFLSENQEQFPIGVAIIGVADAYDEMITDTPHRAGKLPWTAYEEIEKVAGMVKVKNIVLYPFIHLFPESLPPAEFSFDVMKKLEDNTKTIDVTPEKDDKDDD